MSLAESRHEARVGDWGREWEVRKGLAGREAMRRNRGRSPIATYQDSPSLKRSQLRQQLNQEAESLAGSQPRQRLNQTTLNADRRTEPAKRGGTRQREKIGPLKLPRGDRSKIAPIRKVCAGRFYPGDGVRPNTVWAPQERASHSEIVLARPRAVTLQRLLEARPPAQTRLATFWTAEIVIELSALDDIAELGVRRGEAPENTRRASVVPLRLKRHAIRVIRLEAECIHPPLEVAVRLAA